MDTLGIAIRVPEQTPAHDPEDIAVHMVADLSVYHATNGILDRALELVLVRRDMPGVGLLAKTDPDMLFVEEPPLSRDSDAGTLQQVSMEHRFGLLDFGARHDGAANYFVFASFARWVSAVCPMEVRHATRSVGAGDARPLGPLSPALLVDLPEAPAERGVWARQSKLLPDRIEGILRTPFRMPLMRGDAACPPFVTVVAVRLDPAGGVAAASFLLDPLTAGTDFVARFSIALADLAPPLAERPPCPCRIMVFSGDYQAHPFTIGAPPAGAGA
jgi:hypothetical protein